jgi:hypothetical protein
VFLLVSLMLLHVNDPATATPVNARRCDEHCQRSSSSAVGAGVRNDDEDERRESSGIYWFNGIAMSTTTSSNRPNDNAWPVVGLMVKKRYPPFTASVANGKLATVTPSARTL